MGRTIHYSCFSLMAPVWSRPLRISPHLQFLFNNAPPSNPSNHVNVTCDGPHVENVSAGTKHKEDYGRRFIFVSLSTYLFVGIYDGHNFSVFSSGATLGSNGFATPWLPRNKRCFVQRSVSGRNNIMQWRSWPSQQVRVPMFLLWIAYETITQLDLSSWLLIASPLLVQRTHVITLCASIGVKLSD